MTDDAERLDPCAGRSGPPEPQRGLRQLALPETATGALWLTRLPDSDERLACFLADTAAAHVKHVLILTEDHEIREFAPGYAELLSSPHRPFSVTRSPIRDFGVPDDAASFRETAGKVAAALQQGERMVAHCRGGIGRTGLMAQAVLIELGAPPALAARRVAEAGSKCETAEQAAFLREAFADVED